MAAPDDLTNNAMFTSIVAAVIGFFFSVIGIWIAGYFTSKDDKQKEVREDVKEVKDDLDKLGSKFDEFAKEVQVAHCGIKEHIHAITSRVEVMSTEMKHLYEMTMKQEGKHDVQMKIMEKHIGQLSLISSQLKRLFEVIDAPMRATDKMEESLRSAKLSQGG